MKPDSTPPPAHSNIQHIPHKEHWQPKTLIGKLLLWAGRKISQAAMKLHLIRTGGRHEVTPLIKRTVKWGMAVEAKLERWNIGEGSHGVAEMVSLDHQYMVKKTSTGVAEETSAEFLETRKKAETLFKENKLDEHEYQRVVQRSHELENLFVNEAKNEQEVLTTFDHENIVKAVKTTDGGHAIEYAGASLDEMMALDEKGRDPKKGMPGRQYTPLRESELESIGGQIMKGLEYIHNKGYCHGDLKLGNVAIDQYGRVKLIDFGLSRKVSECPLEPLVPPMGEMEAGLVRRISTDYLIPPEAFCMTSGWEQKADMWALGNLIALGLLAKEPYKFFGFAMAHAKTPDDHMKAILHRRDAALEALEKSNVSDQAYDLVAQLMEPDPEKRLTIQQAMEHPFFTEDRFYDASDTQEWAPDPEPEDDDEFFDALETPWTPESKPKSEPDDADDVDIPINRNPTEE